MAAYVSIPRDLTQVKSKIFLNLTKRQLICFGSAAAVGVPTFFGLRHICNTSLAVLGMMVVMIPFFFFALYEKDGMPLEVLLRHFIQAQFVRPKVRIYQTDNYYAALVRQDKVYREVETIVHGKGKNKKPDTRTAKEGQSGRKRKPKRK